VKNTLAYNYRLKRFVVLVPGVCAGEKEGKKGRVKEREEEREGERRKKDRQ
jgi:hypothetical protein